MPRKTIVIQKRELDIPQDKIAEYQEAFNMFDINKDGLLTVDEIYKMMKNYGYPLPKTEIKKIFKSRKKQYLNSKHIQNNQKLKKVKKMLKKKIQIKNLQ